METANLKMFVETIHYESELIWIKPLCDFFQISGQNQYRKIKKDAVLQNLWTKKSADLGVIDENGRILLTQKGFLRWVQTINANIVDVNLRSKFILYQNLIFDFFNGSMQERNLIAQTNSEIQYWKKIYSEAGKMIRNKQAELTELLNARYQYKLQFSPAERITPATKIV